MKVYICLIIVLFLLVFVAAYTYFWLDSFYIEMKMLAEKMLGNLLEDNYLQTRSSYAVLKKNWDENIIMLHCVIKHSFVEQIGTTIIRIGVYIEQNNIEEAALEGSILLYELKNLSDLEKLTLENIF